LIALGTLNTTAAAEDIITTVAVVILLLRDFTLMAARLDHKAPAAVACKVGPHLGAVEALTAAAQGLALLVVTIVLEPGVAQTMAARVLMVAVADLMVPLAPV